MASGSSAAVKCMECAALTSSRCAKCNNTRMRVQRRLKTPDEKAAYANMSESSKARFLEKCADLYGDDLDRAFKSTFAESNAEENNVKLAGNGDWMDEEDLRRKYADKPKRLDAILRNAARWRCPVSETELIEDMTYKTVYENNQLHKVDLKRTLETEETLKKAKKPKQITSVETTKKEEAARDKKNEPKHFNESQAEALRKHKEVVVKAMGDLRTSRDEASEKQLMPFMPTYMEPKISQAIAAATVTVSDLDVVLDANKGAYKVLCAKIVETKKDLIDTKKRFDMLVSDAALHK